MALTKVSYSMINGALINVLDYGADPTGIANSSIAIQAALNTGKSVYVPTGTYKIMSTLLIGDNQTLWAESDAVFNANADDLGDVPATPPAPSYDGYGNPMLRNSDPNGGNSNVHVIGGVWNRIESPTGAVLAGANIEFNNVQNGTIANIYTNNSTDRTQQNTIYTQVRGSICAINNCQNVLIDNCHVPHSVGCHNFFVWQSDYITVQNCVAKDTVDSTYNVDESSYVNIISCLGENSSGSHISFNGLNGRIENNMIICDPDDRSAVNLPGINLGHATITASSSGTVCIGNVILNIRNNNGIQLQGGSERLVVSNNIIKGTNTANKFTFGGDGISVATPKTIISNNVITGAKVGVYLTESSGGNTVTGNAVYLCDGAGFSIQSSDNTISNNISANNGKNLPFGALYHAGIEVIPHPSNVAEGNNITGNNCYNETGVGSQTLGIVVTSNNNLIIGNVTAGHASRGMDILGTDCQYLGNHVESADVTNTISMRVLANTGTPSILNASVVATGGTTSLTSLSDGYIGQIVTIIAEHNVSVVHGSTAGTFRLNGGSNYNMTPNDTLTVVYSGNKLWVEMSRSVN